MILSTWLYATYTKTHPTGLIYVGRTSGLVRHIGLVWADKIIRKRDRNHHKNKEGYGDAVLDEFSTDKNAIRGREQQLIDEIRRKGVCGNDYDGISKRNKKRQFYLLAAVAAFGYAAIMLLIYWYFFLH